MENKDTFFNKFSLKVENSDVEVGKTYPIYGMITKIINEVPGEVEVELNYSLIAKLNLNSADKVEAIKRHAFEPGIFVSTIVKKESEVTEVDCHTVIFGKRKSFDA